MKTRPLVVSLFMLLLILFPVTAQDDAPPTIAILRLGSLVSLDITEGAILDLLESYGFISAEENRILEERRNHQGESINIVWGDAGFDLPTVNFMVEHALDHEVDVLVTLNAPVALVAVNATLDMEDPPVVLFTSVSNPYESGIAAASCIKPDHVTGSESLTSYEYVLSFLRLQDPDLTRVGTVYATTIASGAFGAQRIAELAQEMDISVVEAGITSMSELRAATERVVERGAEALVLPIDYLTTAGLPIIVTIANENGVPVFHPSMGAIYYGATIGAGFSLYYEQGVNVGRMLTAHLSGDLDVATTGINVSSGNLLGVNLDSANLQGVEVSSAIMQEADVVLSGGQPVRVSPQAMQAIRRRGVVVPLEDRQDEDTAFLEALRCTPEMIAEQQAELDIAGN